VLAVPAVVAGDEHVDGRDDEECKERADEQASHKDQTYGVTNKSAIRSLTISSVSMSERSE